MAVIVPLTMSREAADFMAEMRLADAYQQILEKIPSHFSGVRAIAITLAPPYEEGSGPEVIFEVSRSKTDARDDCMEENWRRWIIDTFPPEIFTHFCLLSDVQTNAG